MISLDQVLLLEEKVESAVQKIAQLKAENDALRTKCAELTNSLSAKTEQLSSFAIDQNKIEEGILKALERLNSVENSVLKTAALTQTVANKTAPQTESNPASEPDNSLFGSTASNTAAHEKQNPFPTNEPPVNPNGQFDIF